MHGSDRLLCRQELFGCLIVPGLRRKGPVAGSFAGLVKPRWIDRFIATIVGRLIGRESRVSFLAHPTVFGLRQKSSNLDGARYRFD